MPAIPIRRWLFSLCISTTTLASADEPRLNEIQLIGTHNSYHIAPVKPILDLIGKVQPSQAMALDYHHQPLHDQLNAGIRQFELDIFADPEGGLFANPMGHQLLQASKQESGWVPHADMQSPGFKVLHVQDIDFRTTVRRLDTALDLLLDWSESHQNHEPLCVLIEPKADVIPQLMKPVSFTPEMLDELDALLISKLGKERLISPDLVRGNHSTIREAVIADGWPRLDKCRNKMMFVMCDHGELRKMYTGNHHGLANRVMFTTTSDPNSPEAAFFKLNDPVSQQQEIQELVRQGFLVRTRADAETVEARTNNTTRRDAAFTSGAQFISTDFWQPDDRFSAYRVELPEKAVWRLNPVTPSKQ